jgi:hypothetical protein
MIRVLLALLFALVAVNAEAGPFRRRPTTNQSCTSCNQGGVVVEQSSYVGGSDDQSRCQQEANLMAARRIRGHVGDTIGRFEGVGYGGSPGCATCTPEAYGYRGLRLSGDASAQGSDGYWYRVRSWR